MADIFEDCYSCSRECVNDQFCPDSNISLPTSLKIRIIANPEYWGFDDGNENVLVSGLAVFNRGRYDFFDGYQENHEATKFCGGDTSGPYKNEQRPDVLYRSVFDPEDELLKEFGGKRHYGSDGSVDNVERGGAEVYLIDRQKGLLLSVTGDNESCDDVDPRKIFKKVKENFGFGNKILSTDSVYKNQTGAWRFSTYESCYDNYSTAVDCPQCTGVKQKVSDLDPLNQVLPSGFSNDCLSDGFIPRVYGGTISQIYRNLSDGFVRVRISYFTGRDFTQDLSTATSGEATSLFQGSILSIDSSRLSGVYPVMQVSHSGTFTECKLAGTYGSNELLGSGGYWILNDSYDPNSCCGKKAYNVSDLYKRSLSVTNYHADFGRIFNNPKNYIQSNRFPDNRFTYNLNPIYPIVSSGTFREDVEYPTVNESGVVFESSGYPLFEKEFSYFGPFYLIDKFDNNVRHYNAQNTTKGNNNTCYSSKASLEIFPDCFSQWSDEYENCVPEDVVVSKTIPRLAFVYRGCDFEDPCSYNSSGIPYVQPSSIQDLRRGLAGQEIYMYVNLDSVWTTKHNHSECDCTGELPGKDTPEFVEVPSPVTFPSFPKFDLDPINYGCEETMWRLQSIRKCDPGFTVSKCSTINSPYACLVRQPYTTYGFIRNLCGKSSDDKRKVITESFDSVVQQGNFRNTNASGINEPMYWEYNNPYIHESGGITNGLRGSGNYPFWGLSDTVGRLVSPYYRTKVITSSRKCGAPPPSYSYLGFDECSTHQNGWPTDKVPFLVEIDHDDDCVSCASIAMENSNLHIDLSSLDVKFSHDRPSFNGAEGSHMYGFNHCKYPGMSFDPSYTCTSGFNVPCNSGFAVTHAQQISEARNPYVGDTCSCVGDGNHSFSMTPVNISGSTIPIGWRTDGGTNSFVKLTGCGLNKNFLDPDSISIYGLEDSDYYVYASFKLACSESLFSHLQEPPSGLGSSYSSNWWNPSASSPLNILYNGSTCSFNFPSADSDLKLQAKFVAIPSGYGYPELFEKMPDYLIDSSLEDLYGIEQVYQRLIDSLEYNPMYILEYGCLGYNGDGSSGNFVGACYQCRPTAGLTASCDCDGVTCNSCNEIINVDGKNTDLLPARYRNICRCDCNLQLMRKYLVDCSGTKSLVTQYDNPSCSGTVVAVAFSGEKISSDIIYLGDFVSKIQFLKYSEVYGESACRWHIGPNAVADDIYYEFEEPYREIAGDQKCSLHPYTCDGSCANDPQANVGACKDPIPWTGVPPANGVSVNKKSCFPEIMIVNKVECSGNQFRLHVSREYHSHNRQWYYVKNVGSPPQPVCCPKQIGAYRSGGVCIEIPYLTPTDSVTPAYPYQIVPTTGVSYTSHIQVGASGNRGVCSAHYSSGNFSNQDFSVSYNSSVSGNLWNYFNLFYSGNYPTAAYVPAVYIDEDCNIDCSGTGSIYSDDVIFNSGSFGRLLEYPPNRSGMDWTNQFHSCLQDHQECGSEIYCNKMFFPRKSYKVGTKISRFGPLQICQTTYDRKMGDWYSGYQDFDSTPSVIRELSDKQFVDACNVNNIVYLQSAAGIDDTVLLVNDYLPLTNFGSGLFRYTSSTSSCTIIGSGCHILPEHSNTSVSFMYGGPRTYPNSSKNDTMGYYLDKVSFLDTDNCLFNPFKILVDVECCSSKIRNKNKKLSNPTSLEYMIDNVPSWSCNGLIKNVPCSCGNSNCVTNGGVDNPLKTKKVCVDVFIPGGPGCVSPTKTTGGLCSGSTCGTIVEGYPTVFCPSPGAGVDFIYNPEVLGSGGYVLINSFCDSPTNSCKRATSISSDVYIIKCGSVTRTAVKQQRMAILCDDGFLYFGKTAVGYGCCDNPPICTILNDGYKVDPANCFVANLDSSTSNINSFMKCGCQEIELWKPCQDSIIKAIITEE